MNNYSLTVACVFAITVLVVQGADGLTCKVCTAGTSSTCTTGASTCTASASNGWCYNFTAVAGGSWSQNCLGTGVIGFANGTNITAGCTTIAGATTCFCNSKDQCNSSPVTFAPSMFIVLFAMVSMFAVNGIAKW